MSALPVNPLQLVMEVILILGLWALYAAVILGWRMPRVRGLWGSILPLLERERTQAVALGWSLRDWMILRIIGIGVGVGAGIWAGTPLTIVGGLVIGLIGLPYLLAPIAERRRLAMDQALVEMVRTIASLVRNSNQTLDQALADQGSNPHPLLASSLAPLAETQLSIRQRLIEISRRLPTPIANRICLDLLIALSITPEAFLEAANQVLLPQYERDLEIQRRTRAIASGARQSAFIVTALMLLTLTFVLANPNLRMPYQTEMGQLVLAVVAGLVILILWLIHLLTPRAPAIHWDLGKMNTILEQRYG